VELLLVSPMLLALVESSLAWPSGDLVGVRATDTTASGWDCVVDGRRFLPKRKGSTPCSERRDGDSGEGNDSAGEGSDRTGDAGDTGGCIELIRKGVSLCDVGEAGRSPTECSVDGVTSW
jgi:hypothetical protein